MPFPFDRILIIAPHPDDESIAAGGLLQRVVAAGGEVRIVFVTDGDNNPWPLRFLKRKLRISDADRAEWGALRRQESQRALATLGVPPDSTIFLGFPDRLLTRMARAGDFRAREALGAAINEFAPSLLVVPSAFDLHADHRAISWLAHAASSGQSIVTYVIHGRTPHHRLSFRLELTAEEATRKREAIECHQSQLVLSRKRFLSYARSFEEFYEAEFGIVRLDSRLRDWSSAMKHTASVVTYR